VPCCLHAWGPPSRSTQQCMHDSPGTLDWSRCYDNFCPGCGHVAGSKLATAWPSCALPRPWQHHRRLQHLCLTLTGS
jgi:hypothetical protein